MRLALSYLFVSFISLLCFVTSAQVNQAPLNLLKDSNDSNNQAGLVVTLTKTFFEQTSPMIIDTFEDRLSDLQIKDQCSHNKVVIGTFSLCLHDQQIQELSMNKTLSAMSLNSESPYLHIRISNISMMFDVQFNVSSDPTWFKDQGAGKITLDSLNIDFNFTIKNDDNLFKVDYTNQAQLSMDNYLVDLRGKTDISKAYGIAMNSFKSLFESQLQNVISSKLQSSIEHALNSQLMYENGDTLMPVSNEGLNMTFSEPLYYNYSLSGQPSLSSESVSIPISGMFVMQNKSFYDDIQNPLPGYLNDLPLINDTVELMQVHVSQESIESGIRSLHTTNMLQSEYKTSSGNIGAFFPNFEYVYGVHDEVTIKVDSNGEYWPELYIHEDSKNSTLDTNFTVQILNPFNSEYVAVILDCEAIISLQFVMLPNSTISAIVKGFDLNLGEPTAYFESDVNLEDLDSQLDVLQMSLAFMLGEKLAQGLEIPLPSALSQLAERNELISNLYSKEEYLVVQYLQHVDPPEKDEEIDTDETDDDQEQVDQDDSTDSLDQTSNKVEQLFLH